MDDEPEMECPECNGAGVVEDYDTWQKKPGDDIWLVDYPCDRCNGTGVIDNPDYQDEPLIRPMTDEERKRAKYRSGQNDRNVLR